MLLEVYLLPSAAEGSLFCDTGVCFLRFVTFFVKAIFCSCPLAKMYPPGLDACFPFRDFWFLKEVRRLRYSALEHELRPVLAVSRVPDVSYSFWNTAEPIKCLFRTSLSGGQSSPKAIPGYCPHARIAYF